MSVQHVTFDADCSYLEAGGVYKFPQKKYPMLCLLSMEEDGFESLLH